MTREENIRAKLEFFFKRICELEQEPMQITDRIEYGTDGNAYKLWMSNGKEYEQEPCTDAVSREAVIDCFYGMLRMSEVSIPHVKEYLQTVIDRINELPPVTQKSGKWISEKVDGEDWKGCKRQYYQPISCSKCHSPNHYKSNYCPNCGAKMVEPKESEEQTE